MSEKEIENLKELEKIIGINFKIQETLKTSLIHRSYINESEDKSLSHNERLEFLGDAVLELIITEYLYDKYPDKPEGELTSFRAATVKTTSLAEASLNIDLGKYIYMSKGEEATGGRTRVYILANTFEAILGAIYIDQGYDIAKEFLHKFLIPKIETIVRERLDIDSKSKFQEICQQRLNITPSYELINSTGPDHNKIFTMALKIGKFRATQGSGPNKQEAEQNAAQKAINDFDNIIEKYFS